MQDDAELQNIELAGVSQRVSESGSMRLCRLDVRFARKRTRLGDLESDRRQSKYDPTLRAGSRAQPPLSRSRPRPGQAEAAGYRRDLGSMLRAVLTHELDRERIHPRRR
jgi:hypothetical protein